MEYFNVAISTDTSHSLIDPISSDAVLVPLIADDALSSDASKLTFLSDAPAESIMSSVNQLTLLLQDERVLPLIEFLQTGGPVVWILCLFSLFALALVFMKLWQFSIYQVESKKDLKLALSLWRQSHPEQALNALQTKRPVSAVVSYAMTRLSQIQTPQENVLMKEEIERLADEKIQGLKAYLRPLEVIATLSPLLGLLGTVMGMIVAFQNMESAGSQVDPSVLSGGIWQALLTTAVGLIVAIPVVAIHATFERKVERIVHLMNDAVTQVFTGQGKEAESFINLVDEPTLVEKQNCAA
jgi:biopolymer transport protein ExbB